MLIDTFVIVEIDRGIDSRKMEHLESLSPHIVSTATVMEISTGFFRSDRNPVLLEEFISSLSVVPIDKKIARKAGKIAADFIEESERIEINDLYIAATAMLKEETILTKNVEHFERIDDLEVANWEDL